MPVPKVPAELREELNAMNLTMWICQHPMDYNYEVNGVKGKGRHDTSRVDVQLSGPGLMDSSPWGHGPTVRAAVQDALVRSGLSDRAPGVKGSMMRLEAALGPLSDAVRIRRYNENRPEGEEWDDEVPF